MNRTSIQYLLFAIVIVNACGLFSPVLFSNDSYFYSVVAKHIVMNHDWINLTFGGADWLDKPHLPFWLTALSYKIFGINAFAYMLPGFIFNLIGAFYTYRFGTMFYNKSLGILASIIYLSSIHLLLSSIDIRAEAYLLGEIIPACYYWYKYNQIDLSVANFKERILPLILGSIFTAMAIMTKGIFVIIPIFTGLITINIYTKKAHEFLQSKWLIAYLLIIIGILPELICLYLQFDLHPDKMVFGHTHVSGLKFFFWDSQFGRFFETGPIKVGLHTGFSHYFYFMHTLLWAFLPWSIFLILAVYFNYKKYDLTKSVFSLAGSILRNFIIARNGNFKKSILQDKIINLYIWGSFLPTFILFSLTKFQLDHYTNILIPFLALFIAKWLYEHAENNSELKIILKSSTALSLVLIVLVAALSFLTLPHIYFRIMSIFCIMALALILLNKNMGIRIETPQVESINLTYLNLAAMNLVITISLVFGLVVAINGFVYAHYDLGYNVARYLQNKPQYDLIDYNVNSNSVEFHIKNTYLRQDNLDLLKSEHKPYYLLLNDNDFNQIKAIIPNMHRLEQLSYIPQQQFVATLLDKYKQLKTMQKIDLYFVTTHAVNPSLYK